MLIIISLVILFSLSLNLFFILHLMGYEGMFKKSNSSVDMPITSQNNINDEDGHSLIDEDHLDRERRFNERIERLKEELYKTSNSNIKGEEASVMAEGIYNLPHDDVRETDGKEEVSM